MNSDKKQQERNQVGQVDQDLKNTKNEQSPNQADGFRYDYDDSSDLK